MQDFAVREVLRLPARRRVAVGVLGAEPGGEQPGLRPARRHGRLHQPDVEGLAALRRAEPERHRRPAPGARPASGSWPTSSCRCCRSTTPSSSLEVGHGHPRAADAGVLDHLGGDRPAGPQRLLRRAQVRRQRPRRAGGAGPLLPRAATASTVLHADPSELTLRTARSATTGQRVDLAYRDYASSDLIELETEGVDVEPMRAAPPAEPHDLVDRRRAGPEELLGGPHRPAVHASSTSRRTSGRSSAGTSCGRASCPTAGRVLPDGRPGNLLDYARTSTRRWCSSRTARYGGEGVVIGPAVTRASGRRRWRRPWPTRRPLGGAAAGEHPGQRVPGASARRRGARRAVLHGDGLRADEYGLAVLGRASQKQVVNVAQRGGMCGVLVSRWRPHVGAAMVPS